MGPSKRKGSMRRQVLDLDTKEDSPSRLTWQTKYQHALLRDTAQQNNDSQTSLPSKTNSNPLSEFLGNYNSDSDSEETTKPSNNSLNAKVEDFLKEIQSISIKPSVNINEVSPETLNSQVYNVETYKNTTYPSSVTSWQQCYDQNTGYPYYWNTETNEVTWEMPSDLKAAIASIALNQPQHQHQSLPQQTESQSNVEVKKKSCKYPWQTESDSEDEKIEMITSFGPQSGEGSEDEVEEEKSNNKNVEKTLSVITSVGSMEYYSQPSKIRNACISLAPEDPEGMNDSSYETSSLLAHGVQDNGPPGDDSFQDTIGIQSESKLITYKPKTFLHAQSKEESQNSLLNISKINNDNLLTENKLQISNEQNNKNTAKQMTSKESNQNPKIPGDVIAQIEKETPSDYKNDSEKEKLAEPKISSSEGSSEINSLQQNISTSKFSAIALVANYSDDSEPEDNNSNEKHKNSVKLNILPLKPLFPIEIPQEKEEKIKPVFPCIEEDIFRLTVDNCHKETLQEDLKPSNNIYKPEVEITDPGAYKAFKRKKRIEFATTYGPSTSKLSDAKTLSLESGVINGTSHYYMDPNSNERRGFGFSLNKYQPDGERKTYKNCGGIQFVKAETINLKHSTESNEKFETEKDSEKNSFGENSLELGQSEEIQDSATLLKEKVGFLTGGNKEISPIQHMAIELETLVLAWQQGALAPLYLLRWLNEKCAELIHHEKKAAPSGWTCLWDRQNKRYFYRNTTTKAIQLEYPNVDEKLKTKEDVEAGGDEMDICDTPPHSSPSGPLKQTDEQPSPPPPPVISNPGDYVAPPSPTPQAPSPPKISFYSENEPLTVTKSVKRKKRKIDEITSNDKDDKNISISAALENSENVEPAPPLPPMPPPPPPPPEESPPPLPESPPPLPLDTDQPLPPGVDEPEYSLYRRVSPKHCYKKTPTDSSAYSTELMMTFGYGLPVVPSNNQAMTLPLQTLEYHTYMHDPVTNPYLVQPSSTSHVIQCSAKKPKVSLNSELMSFYSDLAMLESPSESSSNSQPKSQPAAPEPEPVLSPVIVTTASTVSVTTSTVSVSSSNVKNNESVTSNGVNTKKKKKAKTTAGLLLKKKGVSSLVAKWQQVQQEVKKDFSDDEDVSTTK